MGIDQIAVPSSLVVGYTGNAGTIRSPNIAGLAAEGMLFQNWYASFHVCSPSRASMITGRYSIRSGIGVPKDPNAPTAFTPQGNMVFTADSVGGLPENETTTAEALKRVGYWCGMVGKWHLGVQDQFLPTSRGFDEYIGIPFSHNMGATFWDMQEGGANNFHPTPLPLLNGTRVIEQPTGLHTLARTYVDVASGFISRQTARRMPWYVYVSFNHIHEPNACSAAFCGRSRRGAIGDAVEEVDWAVGKIMRALKQSGADDNTLVLFTSDNGSPVHGDPESSGNGLLRGFKGETWEGGFRVPGIARWPGRIRSGAVSRALVGNIDVHPTLLSLAAGSVLNHFHSSSGGAGHASGSALIDGIDLSPVLFASESGGDEAAGRRSGHDCIFFYWAASASDAKLGLSAVRCGAFKAYYSTHGYTEPPAPHKQGRHDPPLLFDLEADPAEEHPISPHSDAYKAALPSINDARAAHLATITPVPDQMGLGSNPAYAICGAPHSSETLPELPACTLTPDNWRPAPICAMAACLESTPVYRVRCKQGARRDQSDVATHVLRP